MAINEEEEMLLKYITNLKEFYFLNFKKEKIANHSSY